MTEQNVRTQVRMLKSFMDNNSPEELGLTPLMFKCLISNVETFNILQSIILDFWNSEETP